jgi:hypothetical protein
MGNVLPVQPTDVKAMWISREPGIGGLKTHTPSFNVGKHPENQAGFVGGGRRDDEVVS